jgi:hypothetical protein
MNLAETKTLAIGVMQIYDFGAVQLHAYQTRDPMNEECYLLETKEELIGIETPAFSKNLAEYVDYIKALDKPLNHLILVNHGNGGKLFKKSHIYSTASTRAALQKGGHIRSLIDNSARIFGAEFDSDIPEITNIIPAGRVKIGCLDFFVTETSTGFDLEITPIHCIYTHMVGSHSHNILPGPNQIGDMLRKMKGFKAKNYRLILTSHEVPETIAAADKKIRYLEKTHEILRSSRKREDFMSAMKTAFPDFAGENYLEMSAGALFR